MFEKAWFVAEFLPNPGEPAVVGPLYSVADAVNAVQTGGSAVIWRELSATASDVVAVPATAVWNSSKTAFIVGNARAQRCAAVCKIILALGL